MKIENDGKTFELDFDKALQLGLAKEVLDTKLIVAGNIFKAPSYRAMLLVQLKNDNFVMVMCDNDSDFFGSYDREMSAEGVLKYLNGIGAKYIGNLSLCVPNYVRNLVELDKAQKS